MRRGIAVRCGAMQKQARIIAYNEMWEKVQNAHSYNEALEIIGKEVTLIDTAK